MFGISRNFKDFNENDKKITVFSENLRTLLIFHRILIEYSPRFFSSEFFFLVWRGDTVPSFFVFLNFEKGHMRTARSILNLFEKQHYVFPFWMLSPLTRPESVLLDESAWQSTLCWSGFYKVENIKPSHFFKSMKNDCM